MEGELENYKTCEYVQRMNDDLKKMAINTNKKLKNYLYLIK